MITYKRGGTYHIRNLFRWHGSVFPISICIAFPCAIAAVLLEHFDIFNEEERQLLLNNTSWSAFSFLVGFLVIFRTAEANTRFWEGATAIYGLRGRWFEACSELISYCSYPSCNSDSAAAETFQNILVRLFSLMHAMAMAAIEDQETAGNLAMDYPLLDAGGIDKGSWKALRDSSCRVELVHSWIQALIVENMHGVLSIPPPILSRPFQELGCGLASFQEAMKVSRVPFPFPYAQTCDCLLIIHWFLAPMITVQWTSSRIWASVFCFIQVFILWTLNITAVEIENPFGQDANDLDCKQMQSDFNTQLMCLLKEECHKTPHLSHNAITGTALQELYAEQKNILDSTGTLDFETDASRRKSRKIRMTFKEATARLSAVSGMLSGVSGRFSTASGRSSIFSQVSRRSKVSACSNIGRDSELQLGDVSRISSYRQAAIETAKGEQRRVSDSNLSPTWQSEKDGRRQSGLLGRPQNLPGVTRSPSSSQPFDRAIVGSIATMSNSIATMSNSTETACIQVSRDLPLASGREMRDSECSAMSDISGAAQPSASRLRQQDPGQWLNMMPDERCLSDKSNQGYHKEEKVSPVQREGQQGAFSPKGTEDPLTLHPHARNGPSSVHEMPPPLPQHLERSTKDPGGDKPMVLE